MVSLVIFFNLIKLSQRLIGFPLKNVYQRYPEHLIERYFHTGLAVLRDSVSAENAVGVGSLLLTAEGDLEITPSRYWRAYGTSLPSSKIAFATDVILPWTSVVTIQMPGGHA